MLPRQKKMVLKFPFPDDKKMVELSKQKRNVLISPLNWGLGHASRLLPIIDHLLKEGHQCLIAGESPSIDLIKEAFPDLDYIIIKGFRIQLSRSKHQLLSYFLQSPKLLFSISRDKRTCKKLVRAHNIGLTISDNRYGFRCKKVASIFITHQSSPKLGRVMHWSKPFIKRILLHWMRQFDSCWIPDINDLPSLSGQLSKTNLPPNTHRIGILSRLSLIAKGDQVLQYKFKPDVLIILSGPEPQRSILEDALFNRYKNTNHKVVILEGRPDKAIKPTTQDNITFISHCNTYTYQHLLKSSKLVICRSGYSSIMDLFFVNRKAILIPTPGQYEQEYLALHLNSYFKFQHLKQSHIQQTSRLEPPIEIEDISDFNCLININLPPLP